MSSIFISYRREDSAGYAGRLYDHLSTELGKEHVFMDIDKLEPGTDFVEAIDREIGGCAVLLVVIGDRWLTAADEKGRRLDNPNDFIRIEIGSALRRKRRVIPVLVKNASMPLEHDLPEEIASFARRQAIELSDSRWNYDVKRLVKSLAKSLDNAEVLLDSASEGPSQGTGEHRGRYKEGRAGKDAVPSSTGRGRSSWSPYQYGLIGAGAVALLAVALWQNWPISPEDNNATRKARPEIIANEPFISSRKPTVAPKITISNGVDESQQPKGDLVQQIAPSEESAETAVDRKIQRLLEAASGDIEALRLMSPPERNAMDKYREVLELAPEHPGALKGIEKVASFRPETLTD